MQIFKQPLIHFLFIGWVLFLIFNWTSSDQGQNINPKKIVIDRDTVLTHMQYRSKAFNQEHFSELLDSMGEEELDRILSDLIREEVLYREAMALQLNENDYVIKQRLIQKLEFLTKGFIDAGSVLSEEEIVLFYEENKSDYYVQPYVTFTHIFFDYERHGKSTASELANKTLNDLNTKQVSFTEGTQYGDRFLYHRNYVERTEAFVTSHFGVPMAEGIFALSVDDNKWVGPFISPYGAHLVMLTNKVSGHIPQLNDIQELIEADAQQSFIRQHTENAIKEIIDSYDVEVVLKREDM